MKNFYFILMFLALLTVILFFGFGCKPEKTTIGQTEPFIGGVGGLSMQFMPGMPPQYVFDNKNYPFGIGVKLTNDGEADVAANSGYIEITGLNPSDWGVSQNDLKKNLPENLNGAKKNFDGTILPGSTEVVEFPNLNYQRNIRGNSMTAIRANLCYDYKTYTSTLICVKENLLDAIVSDNAICQISGYKDAKNSKSPVHITNFRQEPLGQDKLQFTFDIEHVGASDGRIFKVTEPLCDDVVTNPERNKIYLKVTSDLNGRKPKCSGLMGASGDSSEGYVQLFETEARQVAPRKVSCTLDISGIRGQFEHQLDIELTYKYLQHMETQIEIRDVSAQ